MFQNSKFSIHQFCIQTSTGFLFFSQWTTNSSCPIVIACYSLFAKIMWTYMCSRKEKVPCLYQATLSPSAILEFNSSVLVGPQTCADIKAPLSPSVIISLYYLLETWEKKSTLTDRLIEHWSLILFCFNLYYVLLVLITMPPPMVTAEMLTINSGI